MRFETRDPFQEKQKREDSFQNDWNRFAHIEYHRLAAEEEGYDDSMEVVEDSNSKARGNESGGNYEQNKQWVMSDDVNDDSLIAVGKTKKNDTNSSAKNTSKSLR